MISLYGCSACRKFLSIRLLKVASAFGIYHFSIVFSAIFDANSISKPLAAIGNNAIHTTLQLPILQESTEPIPANNSATMAGHQRIIRKSKPTKPSLSLLLSTAPLMMLAVC